MEKNTLSQKLLVQSGGCKLIQYNFTEDLISAPKSLHLRTSQGFYVRFKICIWLKDVVLVKIIISVQ